MYFWLVNAAGEISSNFCHVKRKAFLNLCSCFFNFILLISVALIVVAKERVSGL